MPKKTSLGPRRLSRKAEIRSGRLRLAVPSKFLDAIGAFRLAEESPLDCMAVPKGPPLHVQLVLLKESAPYDLRAHEMAFVEHTPGPLDGDSEALDGARWIAEQLSEGQMVVRITKSKSGYKIDLPLWLRRLLGITHQQPVATLFVVGDVVELYSEAGWYEHLALIRLRLADEDGREAILNQIEEWS